MITKPISYSLAEQDFIESTIYSIDFTHLYWNKNTPKKTNRPKELEKDIERIKKKIKEHYIKIQKYRCCYCWHVYHTTHKLIWWTDHIIPKSDNKLLMFEPKNLCVSCPDCNNKKNDQKVLKDGIPNTLSLKSDDYIIIHPHLDKYKEHIYTDGKLYLPINKSSKAIKTIEICKLTRFIGMEFDDEERDPLLIQYYDDELTALDMEEICEMFGGGLI